MTDILRADVPDLLRARYFRSDWQIEYERPTTSAGNQSGYHSAESLAIHSVFLEPFDFGYVANGASIQSIFSGNQPINVLSFPATTSQEGTAVASVNYPFGWPRNEQMGIDVYYFTTAAASSQVADVLVEGDLRSIGSNLGNNSTNLYTIFNLELSGSTGIDTLTLNQQAGRLLMRTMQDAGKPYSLPLRLLRQSSTATDTLSISLHVVGVRLYLVSTE